MKHQNDYDSIEIAYKTLKIMESSGISSESRIKGVLTAAVEYSRLYGVSRREFMSVLFKLFDEMFEV
jgi:hypothetical protein